jgi:hypothetical protein
MTKQLPVKRSNGGRKREEAKVNEERTLELAHISGCSEEHRS